MSLFYNSIIIYPFEICICSSIACLKKLYIIGFNNFSIFLCFRPKKAFKKTKSYIMSVKRGNNSLFVLLAGERKMINSELWHACAGPLVSLPPVGSLVVYFPQGHSEQVYFIYHDSILRTSYFCILNSDICSL